MEYNESNSLIFSTTWLYLLHFFTQQVSIQIDAIQPTPFKNYFPTIPFERRIVKLNILDLLNKNRKGTPKHSNELLKSHTTNATKSTVQIQAIAAKISTSGYSFHLILNPFLGATAICHILSPNFSISSYQQGWINLLKPKMYAPELNPATPNSPQNRQKH